MATPTPDLLALDFDGVVCDGLQEYFQTAWRAYTQVFSAASASPPSGLAEQFYPLRPVIETGWEMPVLLHGLQQGVTAAAVVADWPGLATQLVTEADVKPADLAAAVDGVRDQWIRQDLTGWLELHRFYPGVLPRIQTALAAGTQIMIISTKEGRFIQQLLARQGVALPPECIWGKEVKRPKYESLRQLQTAHPDARLWFVEDRIKALQGVQKQPDLPGVGLFLADWGYNLAADRAAAEADPRLRVLSLERFGRDFGEWW